MLRCIIITMYNKLPEKADLGHLSTDILRRAYGVTTAVAYCDICMQMLITKPGYIPEPLKENAYSKGHKPSLLLEFATDLRSTSLPENGSPKLQRIRSENPEYPWFSYEALPVPKQATPAPPPELKLPEGHSLVCDIIAFLLSSNILFEEKLREKMGKILPVNRDELPGAVAEYLRSKDNNVNWFISQITEPGVQSDILGKYVANTIPARGTDEYQKLVELWKQWKEDRPPMSASWAVTAMAVEAAVVHHCLMNDNFFLRVAYFMKRPNHLVPKDLARWFVRLIFKRPQVVPLTYVELFDIMLKEWMAGNDEKQMALAICRYRKVYDSQHKLIDTTSVREAREDFFKFIVRDGMFTPGSYARFFMCLVHHLSHHAGVGSKVALWYSMRRTVLLQQTQRVPPMVDFILAKEFGWIKEKNPGMHDAYVWADQGWPRSFVPMDIGNLLPADGIEVINGTVTPATAGKIHTGKLARRETHEELLQTMISKGLAELVGVRYAIEDGTVHAWYVPTIAMELEDTLEKEANLPHFDVIATDDSILPVFADKVKRAICVMHHESDDAYYTVTGAGCNNATLHTYLTDNNVMVAATVDKNGTWASNEWKDEETGVVYQGYVWNMPISRRELAQCDYVKWEIVAK